MLAIADGLVAQLLAHPACVEPVVRERVAIGDLLGGRVQRLGEHVIAARPAIVEVAEVDRRVGDVRDRAHVLVVPRPRVPRAIAVPMRAAVGVVVDVEEPLGHGLPGRLADDQLLVRLALGDVVVPLAVALGGHDLGVLRPVLAVVPVHAQRVLATVEDDRDRRLLQDLAQRRRSPFADALEDRVRRLRTPDLLVVGQVAVGVVRPGLIGGIARGPVDGQHAQRVPLRVGRRQRAELRRGALGVVELRHVLGRRVPAELQRVAPVLGQFDPHAEGHGPPPPGQRRECVAFAELRLGRGLELSQRRLPLRRHGAQAPQNRHPRAQKTPPSEVPRTPHIPCHRRSPPAL